MGQVDRQGPASEFNGDVSDLVHRAETQLRKLQPETASSGRFEGGSSLSSLIQRISGTSVSEIEKLIAELNTLRDYLLNEGQRVQREITEYAHMSRAAIESTKVIAESLVKWKTGSNRGSRD
jgi:hypothetical protein